MTEDLRTAYAGWLQQYQWDYFFTTTFRSPRREPYYALKNVWSELEKHRVARAFIGVEPHRTGDLHLHGILAGLGADWVLGIDLPSNIWSALFKRFGRSKVEACNNHDAVSLYCAKYILKAQNSVIDHYGVFGDKYSWNLKRYSWNRGIDKSK